MSNLASKFNDLSGYESILADDMVMATAIVDKAPFTQLDDGEASVDLAPVPVSIDSKLIELGEISELKNLIDESKSDSFIVLNKWEGYVKSIGEGEFVGIVTDLVNLDAPVEEVTVSFDDIDPDDKALISEGAVFYWYIGYIVSQKGNYAKSSIFRFRRLPPWGRRQIASAKKRAQILRKKLFGLP